MKTLRDDARSAFLRQAIQVAVDNVDQGRAPFGALVVLDGQVVGTGVNTEVQDMDPTAHAEVAAIRHACRGLGRLDLVGSVLISSCEPCALCQVACTVAGVGAIFYAAPREFVPANGKASPDLVQMQDTLRDMAGDRIEYVPTPGADEPFKRYVETTGDRA
jgi:tRNA(Arg) A34 adenosine deaminase TadA